MHNAYGIFILYFLVMSALSQFFPGLSRTHTLCRGDGRRPNGLRFLNCGEATLSKLLSRTILFTNVFLT